jgi:hypothetical protein
MIDELTNYQSIYQSIQIDNIFHRIVEAQEINATRQLVDTIDEHDLLEQLIESSKPKIPYDMRGYHYLLSTPFRYPPLNYGSRFGTVHEPSLLYGSIKEATCVAECAFYRLSFFHSMIEAPAIIKAQHTLFTAGFRSSKVVDLSSPIFLKYASQIADKSDYTFTQKLGSFLRNNGFDCLLYSSARDPGHGLNVALYNHVPLKDKKPIATAEWHSQVIKDKVQFKNIRTKCSYDFDIKDFFDHNGRLPMPAD